MLTQEQAIELIKQERAYQDIEFDPNELRASGLTRGQEHLTAPPHIAQLIEYSTAAQHEWVTGYRQYDEKTNRLIVARNIAKIAAIALRALERMFESEALLEKGLR